MHQAINGFGQFLIVRPAVLLDNPRRRPHYRTIGRDVAHDYKSVGAYLDVVAHFDRSQQSRPGTDENIAANRRVTFAVMLAGTAKGYVVKEDTMIANYGSFADHNPGTVVDKKTSSNSRTRVDFKSSQEAGHLRKEARNKWDSQLPQQVDQPMSQYRLKPGVKQKLDVSDGRVIAIDRPYVIENH